MLRVGPAVTWIKVEKPTFDLVGVVLGSFKLAGVLLVVALALGLVLGPPSSWPAAAPAHSDGRGLAPPGPGLIRRRRITLDVRLIAIPDAARYIVSVDRDKAAAAPRPIRRYGNRKLYDPGAGRYVTLEDVARIVAGGHEVEVVDQKTGEDLTSLTLAQVLLEGVKRGRAASRVRC